MHVPPSPVAEKQKRQRDVLNVENACAKKKKLYLLVRVYSLMAEEDLTQFSLDNQIVFGDVNVIIPKNSMGKCEAYYFLPLITLEI